MSRSRTKRRNQRAPESARRRALVAAFVKSRRDPAEFAAHVRKLAASRDAVWPIAEAALPPITDLERAVIARIVAPHLDGSGSGRSKGRIDRAPKEAAAAESDDDDA